MSDNVPKNIGKVIQIDEDQIRKHLGELVRGSVEETLNQLLDAFYIEFTFGFIFIEIQKPINGSHQLVFQNRLKYHYTAPRK